MNTKELVRNLTSLTGVSGAEEPVSDYVKTLLSQYGTVTSDPMNNVLCTFGEGRHILLDAHLDEIGMIVTDITDDGFIKVAKCGVIDAGMVLGYPVSVWGKKELKGVISTLPPHLQSSEDEKKVPDIKQIAVDIGMTKKQAESFVSKGDRITFEKNYRELLNGQISASCLDDRAGVAAVILALEQLKHFPCKITVLFSSQEELGTRGAKTGAYAKNVDEAISVDVSFAYTPGCSRDECGILGGGPMIGYSPFLNREMFQRLKAAAQRHEIPYQLEIMEAATGTNADVISVCENGIKTALISIPEKYMHTPVETVSIADVENTARLIAMYITETEGEENA